MTNLCPKNKENLLWQGKDVLSKTLKFTELVILLSGLEMLNTVLISFLEIQFIYQMERGWDEHVQFHDRTRKQFSLFGILKSIDDFLIFKVNFSGLTWPFFYFYFPIYFQRFLCIYEKITSITCFCLITAIWWRVSSKRKWLHFILNHYHMQWFFHQLPHP